MLSQKIQIPQNEEIHKEAITILRTLVTFSKYCVLATSQFTARVR
jgi:hypothetical protein